jgi:hypothetical protein
MLPKLSIILDERPEGEGGPGLLPNLPGVLPVSESELLPRLPLRVGFALQTQKQAEEVEAVIDGGQWQPTATYAIKIPIVRTPYSSAVSISGRKRVGIEELVGETAPELHMHLEVEKRLLPVYKSLELYRDMSPLEDSTTTTTCDSSKKQARSDGKRPKYSHKLAERERRRDMRNALEQLANSLPDPHEKMNKWEILAAACEHIMKLTTQKGHLTEERDKLRHELRETLDKNRE